MEIIQRLGVWCLTPLPTIFQLLVYRRKLFSKYVYIN